MTALCLVGICAFMALAIDLGILAAARTQCQNAADAASLASTRALDNKPSSVNSNRSAAEAEADAVVVQNDLLNRKFAISNVISKRYGVFDYRADLSPPRFEVSYPANPPAGRSWTATEIEVSGTFNTFFGRITGLNSAGAITGVNSLSTGARAVSVYRPRDIAMTLDMTTSMKFGCMVQANGIYLSNDPVIPKMGHYRRYEDYNPSNPNASSNAESLASRSHPLFTNRAYVRPDTGEIYAPSNVCAENAGGPPAVRDFFYDPANLANPRNLVMTPNANMSAVPPNTPLPRAFHHWNPPIASFNDPDNYFPSSFNYSGWTGIVDVNNYRIYPTPESFGDQSDPNYLGDKWPRKRGAEWRTNPGDWSPTSSGGAAINLAEYLGWMNPYTGGTVFNPFSPPTPATNNTGSLIHPSRFGNTSQNTPTTGSSLPSNISVPTYQTNWSNFRDATWEKYGYDLDVDRYVSERPSNWDPGIDPDLPPPVNEFSPRAYGVIDARRIWWESNRDSLIQPGRFKGYSMGPGYWGKTFWIWPPDPRTPSPDSVRATDSNYVPGDWRVRFFYNSAWERINKDNENVANAVLRDNSNDLPTNTFAINYKAVLAWIKSPPLCLPPNLRAGRVRYYTSIPDDVDVNTGSNDERQDKRFWKQYIDYVMLQSSMCSFETRGWPEGAGNHRVFRTMMTGYDVDGSNPRPADPIPYMNYLDNPNRPRHLYWFGPHTMLAFLNQKNSWAGTVHETQTWQLKAGVSSVLDDIRNNHPNDAVGLCYFAAGAYGFISVGCSQDFELLRASLFYPSTLVNNGRVWTQPNDEFAAFNTSMNWVGRAIVHNGNGGTDPNTGFATCFNILAPSTTANPALPPIPPAAVQVNGRPVATQQTAGRRGRRGASKVVVFETDGVPNNSRRVTFNAQGFNSFYTINTSQAAGDSRTEAYAVIEQMRKNTASGTTGDSGLSLANNQVKVYSIGFGDIFSLGGNAAETNARNFLLEVQKRGGTSGPSDTAIPFYQVVTGSAEQRVERLRLAFERILQSGVQVTLIE